MSSSWFPHGDEKLNGMVVGCCNAGSDKLYITDLSEAEVSKVLVSLRFALTKG